MISLNHSLLSGTPKTMIRHGNKTKYIFPLIIFQFLLASENFAYFLIVDKDEINGADGQKYYGPQSIPIVASSLNCEPYSANWYRRNGFREDPWVSIRNHGDGAGQLMIYGGDNKEEHNEVLKRNGGMNVYIRKKPSCDPSSLIDLELTVQAQQ